MMAGEREAQAELCDADSCHSNSTLFLFLFVWFTEEEVKGIEGKKRGSWKDRRRQADSGLISEG